MSDLTPPCDCVIKETGEWVAWHCECGNKGDFRDAVAWAAEQNHKDTIASLQEQVEDLQTDKNELLEDVCEKMNLAAKLEGQVKNLQADYDEAFHIAQRRLNRIEELEAEIKGLRTIGREAVKMYLESPWIPVSERLPDAEGVYLTITKPDPVVGSDWLLNGFSGGRFAKPYITHWMPIPPSPPRE